MNRTLIVDDSPTMRRMVMVSLRDVCSGGFAEAASGLEAIEQLALGPDRADGPRSEHAGHARPGSAQVRARASGVPQVPVIVLTTRGDEPSRAAALAAGASLYLTKPFAPQALAATRASCSASAAWSPRSTTKAPAMANDPDFLAGFMDDYFVECEEHLTAIRGHLLELERGVGAAAVRPALLEELFRSFHSIKGISGMVELREAEMLAHQMESYLRALRQKDVVLSQRGVDALIAGVQALETTIAARRDDRRARRSSRRCRNWPR
jgi:CheY-like chemotaxis protein